jgi:hypothetical protein
MIPSQARRSIAALAVVAIAATSCSNDAAETEVAETAVAETEAAPESSVAPPSTAAPTAPSSTTTTTTTQPPTTTTTTVPVDEGYAWRAGDCLRFASTSLDSLPYAPRSDEAILDCGQRHTHEVYLAETLEAGADAPFPGEELGRRVDRICGEGFDRYVGLPVPESNLDIVLYLPDAEEWAAGERYVACVVYRPGPLDTIIEIEGTLHRAGGEVAWPTTFGTCFSASFPSPRHGDPVPCDGPHAYEIVGLAVAAVAPDAPFPGRAELDRQVDDECTLALVEYVDGPVISSGVTVGSLPIDEVDWELGTRTFPCIAFAQDEVGRLLDVRGSFAGEWEIVGASDDAVSA